MYDAKMAPLWPKSVLLMYYGGMRENRFSALCCSRNDEQKINKTKNFRRMDMSGICREKPAAHLF
jgi:hypothetical protein